MFSRSSLPTELQTSRVGQTITNLSGLQATGAYAPHLLLTTLCAGQLGASACQHCAALLLQRCVHLLQLAAAPAQRARLPLVQGPPLWLAAGREHLCVRTQLTRLSSPAKQTLIAGQMQGTSCTSTSVSFVGMIPASRGSLVLVRGPLLAQ